MRSPEKFEPRLEPQSKMPPEKERKEEKGNELTKEQIEILEDMSIAPYEKMELILVKAGLKSATSIELASDTWREQEESKKVDRKRQQDIERALGEEGYAYKSSDPEIEKITVVEDDIPEEKIKPEDEIFEEREKIVIEIARNQEELREYLKTIEGGSDKELGKMYGFPESAIEAYLRSEDDPGIVMSRKNLPEDIRKQEWSLFATFMMSKDKWEEELEVVKQWSETVNRISPEIYKEYIEYMKKMTNF
ncbi:MAG: hypothetical protein U9Q96_02265 [Patescibacteria group bacterium]|nr:hypothetical protein [Patescibacteria group bacterium]